MTQREVTDSENTKWTCVEAYAALKEKASEKIAELSENNGDKVTIVCTPGGGAQTVRIELSADWEQLSDEELLACIAAKRN